MFTGIQCLTFIFLLCCANGSENKNNPEEKRFLLDTFFSLFVTAPAYLFASLVAGATLAECEQCRCYDTCTAEKYFNVSEREVCGGKLWDGINCAGVTKAPVTTTVTPAVLTNGTLVTQKPQSSVNNCDRMCTIGSVGRAQSMSSNITAVCLTGSHSGNEALPIVCCDLKAQTSWIKGAKVVDVCASRDVKYTPVAAFVNGEYVRGSAGILLDCKVNGFQMAVQSCDSPPSVAGVSSHKDVYYVIEQY
ncbi:hypothetical protein ACF0H5_023403 [Mactra antiquata]